MKNSKVVNKLAVVGALIVMLGVGSAANEAFAAQLNAGLKSGVSATFQY